MKMRLSLRLYVLATSLFLIVSMAALYSYMSVQYFIEGLDLATRSTMAKIASNVELDDVGKASFMDYQIASRYNDLPESIQQQFAEAPGSLFELQKNIIQPSWFSRPSAAYFLMKIATVDGEERYISRSINRENRAPKVHKTRHFHPLTYALIVALVVIAVFVILLFIIMRSVASPVESLRDWARSLTPETLRKPAPGFRYSELNALAEIIRNSLLSLQQGLDREHDFLRHASHELRTPIAVVRSNVELLRKIDSDRDEKESRIVDRIERASTTMSQLTETLLWLSRDEESPLPEANVALDKLVDQTSLDLFYLLQGKDVAFNLNTQPTNVMLSPVAAQIMLANLIRNAFQHTHAGEVRIEQHGNRVSIINRNNDSEPGDSSELGFGLGLDLTRKLAERFGWEYRNTPTEFGHEVEVVFAAKDKA